MMAKVLMDTDMESLLKELGWGDGFHIPIANEENRALELEIQKKQKEKDNLRSMLEDINERLTAMKKHSANVQHELSQNQNLIFVRQSQINTEENLMKSSRMEENSLMNNTKRMKKEYDDINSRHRTLETDVNRMRTKLENLKSTTKWNQDALQAWDEEVSRNLDDMAILEKFSKEDEIKFNELELRRQNLRLELENKKMKVNNAKNDILCMESSLEKVAQLFRKQHADRQALVRQWEGSVRILHQRDEDINRTIEEIANLKVLAKEKIKDLEIQRNFYDTQEANNKELEKEITALGNENSEKKEMLRLIDEHVRDLNGNIITLQAIIEKVSTDLNNQRSRKKQLMKDIEAKEAQTEEAKIKLNQAFEELERTRSKSYSAADRVQHLEELYANEEKTLEKVLNDAKNLNDLMFQVAEQLKELKEGEKTQKSSLDNIESNITLIKKHMHRAEQELNRQKELIYNMDFQYMKKDIILNKMLGLIKEDNSEKYEKRISELEKAHSQLLATNSLLSKEVGRLEEEMRRLTADMQNDSKELEILNNKRQNNILLTEGGLKQLKAMKMQNQDRQVDENVLKLRVRQAEKAIDKVGGKLFSLEKQRLELEEVMKERDVEIKALRDILNVRRRVLGEQATSLNSRINLAKVKVEHLKKKYGIIIGKLGKDEDGQPLTITYFKVKSAQEKFELQEIGDKLDAKIKKTEKEITAMENTLKVFNASNKAYRNNLQNISSDSPEQMEKLELEQLLVKELDEVRRKKTLLEKVNEETKSLEEIYNEQCRKEEEILNSWEEKKQLIAEIDRELKDQEAKLIRAESQLKKSIKEIRGTLLPKFQTIEEKDIELRELMEQNQSALQQYAEFVVKTIDTGPVVTRYFAEKGIELPMLKSPNGSVKYASSSSLLSPCEKAQTSVRSSQTSRSSSSTALSPSVITLDSSRLDPGDEHRKSDANNVSAGFNGSNRSLIKTKSSVRFSENMSKNKK